MGSVMMFMFFGGRKNIFGGVPWVGCIGIIPGWDMDFIV